MTFEELLREVEPALQRFVRFQIANKQDAEDVLQETRMAAFQAFGTLKDQQNFRAWIIGIAWRKCADHYRSRKPEIPMEEVPEQTLTQSLHGLVYTSPVRSTIAGLSDRDREILRLFFFEDLPQEKIAALLGIPVGTVKSRLHTAKQHFKACYPYPPKGEKKMLTKMPKVLPDYTITPSKELPFPVKWEEIMGWFIVPRLGERLEWAMYDFPEKKRTEFMIEEAVARAQVHGIEGVEILVKEYEPMECNRIDDRDFNERRLVAQLTDTHCRFLAESHESGGVKRYYTFLDGDVFLDDWGFGEDNCGKETHIAPKGDITRDGSAVTTKDKPFLLDVVGRYTVQINGKTYDTVCVMDVASYVAGTVSEQFLDANGRTVLWRRFNADGWGYGRYQKRWTEMYPENETITVNGNTYVHWYDCITDYILLLHQLILEDFCLSKRRNTASEILDRRQPVLRFLPCLATFIRRINNSRLNWWSSIRKRGGRMIVPRFVLTVYKPARQRPSAQTPTDLPRFFLRILMIPSKDAPSAGDTIIPLFANQIEYDMILLLKKAKQSDRIRPVCNGG